MVEEDAIRQIVAEVVKQSAEIVALRTKLADMEASQLGAHDFVRMLDDRIAGETGRRNPALLIRHGGVEPRTHPYLAEPAQVKAWADKYDALLRG